MMLPSLRDIQGDTTIRAILEAMDGLAYIVDLNGTVIAVSQTRWELFASRNCAPECSASHVVGSSLFSMISGNEVQEVYRVLHDAVWMGAAPQVSFEYRCDAPDTARHMRMSLGRIGPRENPVGILYQSVVISEFKRPPMNIFSPDFRLGADGDAEGRPLLKLCSYCHDVMWSFADAQPVWISPEAYYAGGGSPDVWVSHGVCPACFERIIGLTATASAQFA